jgi:hypothetical protein
LRNWRRFIEKGREESINEGISFESESYELIIEKSSFRREYDWLASDS